MADAGKGDSPRPLSIERKKYEMEWDRIFNKISIDNDPPSTGISNQVFEAFSLAHSGVTEWPVIVGTDARLLETLDKIFSKSKSNVTETLEQKCDILIRKFVRKGRTSFKEQS